MNSYKILRSAVEQEVLFPAEKYYREYMDRLVIAKVPFQIISSEDNDDGTITVVIRKQYNDDIFFFADRMNNCDEDVDNDE